jgi:hypothetical protein
MEDIEERQGSKTEADKCVRKCNLERREKTINL